jgi:S-adenosylmethionine:tRNA ribosyltransferase-isomerase
MLVREFDFDLPPELIAQAPLPNRADARLLFLSRATGLMTPATVSSLPLLLEPGDLLVVNDTRVFPARLLGRRVPSGGAVECLLTHRVVSDATPTPARKPATAPAPEHTGTGSLPEKHEHAPGRPGPPAKDGRHPYGEPARSALPGDRGATVGRAPGDDQIWEALMHPGQKLKPGARVVFEGPAALHGEVLERRFYGRRRLRLWTSDGSSVDEAVDAIGHVPLPPYVKRSDCAADRERYQTVFARQRGSIAAPTAGLHFNDALLGSLRERGIQTAAITLHVGYGTFQPVRVAEVEDHHLEPEWYDISPAAADAINHARADGRRIIAVGTTTTRTLEAVALANSGRIVAGGGTTDLFMFPGFQFRAIHGLLTNFHLPRSSLLMLVAAFAGREPILKAYRHAIAEGYRFYSYGDAMLII